MIPNNYMLEQLVIQHRQDMLKEAEHERLLSMIDSRQHASRALPRLAGKLGKVLLMLGTTLRKFERNSQVVAASGKSH